MRKEGTRSYIKRKERGKGRGSNGQITRKATIIRVNRKR